MKEKEIDIVELLQGVWSHKHTVIKWGLIGFVVSLVIAFSIPREYKTVVQLAAESKESSGALSSLGGLASMAGINMNANASGGIDDKLYPEIVKSSPFLNEFTSIKVTYKEQEITLNEYLLKHQKSPWWSYVMGAPGMAINGIKSLFSAQEPEQEQQSVDSTLFFISPLQKAFMMGLSARVEVKSNDKKGTIEVSAKMQDPVIAAQVAGLLVDKLQQYINRYQTNKARADLNNTIEMLEQSRKAYYAADDLYAQTQDRNNNLIAKSALVKLDRLKSERDLAYSVYQQLATQAETYKIKLQEESVIATIVEPAIVSDAADTPNKKMIVVGLTFLFAFAAAIIILIRQLNSK